MKDQQLSDRLTSKSTRQSIITQIARDFNLTPILAEAYFTQIAGYFSRHTEVDLSTGQLHYLAVDENEPAGKPIALSKKVSVKLHLHKPEEDLDTYKKQGLQGLQRPSGNTALKSLLAELKSLREILVEVTLQIRILSLEEPYATQVNHLSTIPGISRMRAMIFLTELVDIHRFKTLDHLPSYAGLAPGEHSSGEREVTTGISS